MFDRILKKMHEMIRARRFVITTHADEEMDEDGLTIFDVERAILNGEIIERQKDQFTEEWKYLVRGQMFSGERLIVVAKTVGVQRLVIITVFFE